MRVVTYQAPNGATIDISPSQAEELRKLGIWPRNSSGEFCQVHRGLHGGKPTYATVADLRRERGMD